MMSMLGGSRRLAPAVAIGLASLALVACGRDDSGGSDGGGGGGDGDGELAAAPGFDGKRFKLGFLTVTSGPATPTVAPLLAGAETHIKAINEKGGIAGKYPIDLVLRDTAADPAKTVQGYNATKNDVAMYAQVFGTPMAKAILPQLKQDKIIALPISSDGSFFREQNILIPGKPNESSLIDGLSYADENLETAGKKVCGAAGEGPLAETVEQVVAYVGKTMKHPTGPTVGLSATSTNYTTQVQQLRRNDCDVVLIVATPIPGVSNTLSAASRLGYDAQWISPPSGFTASLKDSPVMDYMTKHLLLLSDVTEYGNEDAPGMQELMDAHEKFDESTSPGPNYVWAWTNVSLIEGVLTKAVENGDVSREGLIKAMNEITEFDTGGIQFSPTWGPPAQRKPAAKYNAFQPDKSVDTGIRMAGSALESPAASVDFPYETAEE
jgi:ABC-type branched-subunit amino acid transport system substrate-binding protein